MGFLIHFSHLSLISNAKYIRIEVYTDLFAFESRTVLLESAKAYRPIYGGPSGATLERLTSENSVRVSRRRRPIREQSVALCEIEPRDAVYLGILH